MNIDFEDYPAMTFQQVVDLSGVFGGLPAVPQMLLKGVDEMEALIEALQHAVAEAKLAVELSEDMGYPVEAGDQYPGTGVQLGVDGPGTARLYVVGTRRAAASDVPTELMGRLLNESFGDEDSVPIWVEPVEEGDLDAVVLDWNDTGWGEEGA